MKNQSGLIQSLEVRQVISQEMQFSMMILQMSSIELKEYINSIFIENPLLEMEEYESDPSEYKTKIAKEYLEKEQLKYDAVDNSSIRDFSATDLIVKNETFTDYLLEQLGFMELSESKMRICLYIVYSLDDRGYFKGEIHDTASSIGVSEDDFLEALGIIRNLEPLGVGWKTLEETILYQLEKSGIVNEMHREITYNHLEKVAKGNYHSIATEMDVQESIIREVVNDIKRMNPIPSRGFAMDGINNYIIPDAEIERIGNDLIINMFDRMFPGLRINSELYRLARDACPNSLKYINEKYNDAVLLMKSLGLRRSTLESVIGKVVEHQREYLLAKENYLRPLSLKDIAQRLEVHESTISRAVKGKYINTPRGTVALMELFSTGLSSSGGDISSDYIKSEIRKMIDKEDKKKPMSDQKITDILNVKGIQVKRRTVAKYREEDGIPSTKLRRKL